MNLPLYKYESTEEAIAREKSENRKAFLVFVLTFIVFLALVAVLVATVEDAGGWLSIF